MKIATTSEVGKASLVEKPIPTSKEDFVLVKVHVTPMCTEWKNFKSAKPGGTFGHEAVGEVVGVAQPGRVSVGDRVVVQCGQGCGKCSLCLIGEQIHCQNRSWFDHVSKLLGESARMGTYTQYLLKQDWLLSPIPNKVSYEHAGMALCGLGPTFGAMQQMQVNACDTVLITGLGPVGLGGVINARYRGACVIGVEGVPYRVKLAKELGAETVINPHDENALQQIIDLTSGLGVDKAVDCSGESQAIRLMVDATRRKGQCSFVGEGGEFPLAASRDMIRKGLVLRGNWHYNITDYPLLMKVIQESPKLLDKLITHTFPMSEVQKAWDLQTTLNCGKVVLYPWK
jgi:L-iditol 2-dehydrogenase